VIPYNVRETLDISMFEGCTSLKYVTVVNPGTTFVEGLPSVNTSGTIFNIAKFKSTVPKEFYFEGEDGSLIHEFCGEYAIAFKYMDENVYEIVIHEEEDNLDSPKATYRVTSANQLILCDLEKGLKVVDMPDTIGPAKIEEIASTSFQNNCYLEKVYIPSSVISIRENAFQGCHNLQHVIFNEPMSVETIEANAFQTQNVAVHNTNCNGQLTDTPALTFTGPISYDSAPYVYAMNPASNINVGSQQLSYITYYSGWPSNLSVKYNPTTDKNELIDYPTFADLTDYATMPYIKEHEKAALSTALKNRQEGKELSQDEQQIVEAVMNLQLAQGIEAVQEDLFVKKEGNEVNLALMNMSKTITTYSINEILPRTFEGCSNVKSIYINGDTYSIGDYAFENCEDLENLEISATVTELGKRPFVGCDKLTYVNFQGSPYFTCDKSLVYGLTDGQKTSIIECLESRGKSSGSSTIETNELIGVTSIAEEAFKGCDGIGSVNMTGSSIGEIPVSAFEDTNTLYSVYLPDTCRAIWANAFANSNVRYLEIPNSVAYIDPDAFYTNVNHPDECLNITFFCQDDSNAKVYADIYDNIDTTTKEEVITYTVYFMGMDGSILDKQTVIEGEDAVPPTAPEIDGFNFVGWAPSYEAVSGDLNIVAQYTPIDPDSLKVTVNFIDYDDTILKSVRVTIGEDAEPPVAPEREGYRFTGWRPAITNITEDTDIYAQYEKMDSDEFRYTVKFLDHDDTVLKEEKVSEGESAQPPTNPTREGYLFTGWRPDYTNITGDTTIYAQYEKIDSEDSKFIVRFIDFDDTILYTQKVNAGEDAITPKDPEREGYEFTGWRPAITNITQNTDTYAQYERSVEPTATPGPTAAPAPTATPAVFYTLTVRNGSGSGSYPAGEKVIIIANDPASGQEFDNWTVDPGDVKLASKYATATVIEMPAKAVLVTANYKVDSGSGVVGNRPSSGSNSSAGNVGGSSSSVNNNKPTSTNGTTVVINKNGLSNTGVVAVQVNGSSDNFVMKISENSNATEEALRALMNKYTDLDGIVYFPMDITLYDSTGTRQITDTTGLSINITLPIPDSMITYAGNNRIAAVVNGKLQELTPSFKTISGVSCISFTATHFSPYVIYVDTDNLTAGVITDSTPKTGDGIHPKWFLSVGLLCISIVLFLKKDKVVKENTKRAKLA
ncbi:MAG: leucine-rich repeat protein, partial [Lachnospiraceae bacterium]|nr:leucine-rich repeat protein [Lachnospiraceae bacterium]